MNEIKIKIGDGDAQDSFEAHKLIYLDSDKRTEAPIKKRDVTSYAGEAGEHTDPRTVPDAFDYTVSFIIDGQDTDLGSVNASFLPSQSRMSPLSGTNSSLVIFGVSAS